MTDQLDDARREVQDLAAGLFRRYGDPARLDAVDASDERFDRELWTALADSGLLGAVVPEDCGGLGMGAVEMALVLEQFGWALPKVPLVSSYVVAAVIARHGDDGTRADWLPRLATGAAVAAVDVTGTGTAVLWAHVADVVAVVAGDDVLLVEPGSSPMQRGETSGREIANEVHVDATAATRLPGAAMTLRQWWRTALAAQQAGCTDAAVRMAAHYTSHRLQFGKPLSTFQGVALRAADAFIDATVIHEVAMKAAWSLDHPDAVDVELATLSAAWWAADAGQRCVHATQHLHGGMGADVTYPVHRFFLAGKQIEVLLGGASALLADLGDALADGRAGLKGG